MPLFGTLKLMPLPDLLQWLGTSRKTGTLQVEHDRVSKSILFDSGQVIGCSSDDPPLRLGQFLLSRGRITEHQLREALGVQERTGNHLGMILVELGALSSEELYKFLEAKAEETIYSLFDRPEAVFRFHPNLSEHANIFPVSLRVEDILLRGLQRFDEMKRIREVFDDHSIVLAIAKPLPEEWLRAMMPRKLHDAIDGQRTIAEILLHVHGGEYVVTKVLFDWQQSGYLEILGKRSEVTLPPLTGVPAGPAGPTGPTPPPDWARPPEEFEVAPERGSPARPAPDEPSPASPSPAQAPPVSSVTPDTGVDEAPLLDIDTSELLPGWQEGTPLDFELEEEGPRAAPDPAEPVLDALEQQLEAPPATEASAPAVQPPAAPAPAPSTDRPAAARPDARGLEPVEQSDAYQLERKLEQARNFMSKAEFESALDVLDALYRQFPGDESLRKLSAEAEAAFVDKAYRHYLPPSKIPVLTQPMEQLESSQISPSEFFLLSRIDGTWDIKSIIQIAPIRETEALRILKRMRESGIIDLQDPPD